jgi:phosphate starvation-inducible PhoH-like protein
LNELKLSIEQVNPAVLWGPNNDHFEIIKKQYPKLKIVARGSEVKVLGDEQELARLPGKISIVWCSTSKNTKALTRTM